MKAAVIKIAIPEGFEERPGWIVPDTDELLGIDLRGEGSFENGMPPTWAITHLPSGRRIRCGHYTAASTSDEAAGLAQRFFSAYRARGWDLNVADHEAVIAPLKALGPEEARKFWEEIADWETAKAKSA